jgi:hypothetical protein
MHWRGERAGIETANRRECAYSLRDCASFSNFSCQQGENVILSSSPCLYLLLSIEESGVQIIGFVIWRSSSALF